MGNGYRGCGPHGAIGYRQYVVQGYGHMGQYGTGVLGYKTRAMGTGVWGILCRVYPLTPP